MGLTDHRPDLHWFLRTIEDALIEAIAEIGIVGRRFAPHTGVWVGEEKIAAIGVKVTRWVSTHGFALNVCPRMSHFGLIVPCGIRQYGVTSLSQLLCRDIAVAETLRPVARAFSARFGPAAAADPAGDGLGEVSRRILDQARIVEAY